MSTPLQWTVAAYVLIMFLMMFYGLVRLWPPDKPTGTALRWLGIATNPDVRLLLIAALAGGLGAFVHLGTSFANFAGFRELSSSWAWWYLLRPFTGMALAEIVYLAARGGLISGAGGAGASAVNPYGVAAFSALTGLFSKQAIAKLEEVFNTMFRAAPKPPATTTPTATATVTPTTPNHQP